MDLLMYERFMGKFNELLEEMKKMSVELETLTAQVAANNEVIESAMTLIQGLATKIEALKDDPAALQALADQLKAEDEALAAAIAANTAATT